MTPEAIASIVAAGGSVIAATMAASAARTAARQMQIQFIPRLIVRGEAYQIKTTSDLKDGFFWTAPGPAARYENGGSEDYRFNILNIGNGMAFDIRIHTEFDYQAIYSDVMGKLEKFLPDLRFIYDQFGCQVRLGERLLGGFRLPDQAFGVVEMIGPASTPERRAAFLIDPNLSFLASCYAYYLMVAHESEDAARVAQTIPVSFKIEYLDPSGLRRTVQQAMFLSIRGGQYTADGSDGVSLISLHEGRS